MIKLLQMCIFVFFDIIICIIFYFLQAKTGHLTFFPSLIAFTLDLQSHILGDYNKPY